MSPLVVIQYLRRRAAISADRNSGATTREATVLLLIAELIQQLESENAELRRALKLSGQVMRNSVGEEGQMTHIPNDIARCPGVRVDDEWLSDCAACARRTSPPTDSGRVSMMQPPEDVSWSACAYKMQEDE